MFLEEGVTESTYARSGLYQIQCRCSPRSLSHVFELSASDELRKYRELNAYGLNDKR